jgi:hypothetical protein
MNSEIMQRWLEMVEYRIVEGSEYGWDCFGSQAYCLDHYDMRDINRASFNITFDRVDQTVYALEAHDYRNDRAYRWIAPSFKEAYETEAKRRGVSADEAWDDVNYVDLEVLDDFFQKGNAIYQGKDYDTRVSIPLEFTDEELLTYMTMAHERDMTFNQFVEEAIKAAIEEFKRDPEGAKQRAQRWKDEKNIL